MITNKIHDLTTLRASCHECFDYIKTLLHVMSSILSITASQHTSSLRLASHQCRHASVMQLYVSSKNFTRISIVDRFDFFWVTQIVTSFLEPCAPLVTRIAKIINLLMSSEMSWVVHIKITRAVIWISLDTEYPRCAASPCVALQHVQTYIR